MFSDVHPFGHRGAERNLCLKQQNCVNWLLCCPVCECTRTRTVTLDLKRPRASHIYDIYATAGWELFDPRQPLESVFQCIAGPGSLGTMNFCRHFSLVWNFKQQTGSFSSL